MKDRYCVKCGEKREGDALFCRNCGTHFLDDGSERKSEQESERQPEKNNEPIKSLFSSATEKVNRMVGEEGALDLKLKDLFSSVFEKHSKEEAELLFISGTSVTTPHESEISTSWPKPWLFSRVFLILVTTYVLLYVSTYSFENTIALPGLIIMGSFAVPFSLLIFFWESNAPRNISLFEIVKMFFIGGVASIVTTLFIFSIFPVYNYDYQGAISIGIIEETGKLLIAAFFIRQLQIKYILNGLLIGAAIGAGFAAFESAGYAFHSGLAFGDEAMLSNLFDRAWMSIGSHVIWTAIAAGALVYVKENSELAFDHFKDTRFLKLFLVPVLLHTAWNSPFFVEHNNAILYLLIIALGWIFIFSLMNAGLKQISRNHG